MTIKKWEKKLKGALQNRMKNSEVFVATQKI